VNRTEIASSKSEKVHYLAASGCNLEFLPSQSQGIGLAHMVLLG